uniref:Tnp_DDE_dom domain-containing protein n=1 Tax=Steinernema glaseri TaxID=37863 RepID=A0A1I7ZDY1_9BILA
MKTEFNLSHGRNILLSTDLTDQVGTDPKKQAHCSHYDDRRYDLDKPAGDGQLPAICRSRGSQAAENSGVPVRESYLKREVRKRFKMSMIEATMQVIDISFVQKPFDHSIA